MIHEITQFIDYLEDNSPDVFSENLELKEGLYVFLEKEGDELVIKNENILKVDKNVKKNDFTGDKLTLYNNFVLRYDKGAPITSNKAFNRTIFGLTANPFSVGFKMEQFRKEEKYNEKTICDSLKEYFKNADKYIPDDLRNDQQPV